MSQKLNNELAKRANKSVKNNLIAKDGNIYLYVDNEWQQANNKLVFNSFYKGLVKDGFTPSSSIEKEYIYHLEQQTSIEYPITLITIEEFLNRDQLILFKNFIYDIEKDEIIKYEKEYLVTNKLPFNYDKNAKAKRFTQFIDEVIDDKYKDLIQEFMGYTLTTSKKLKLHKALILQGVGGNGKSVLLDVWCEMLGSELISSVSLDKFSIPNSMIRTKGKNANIIHDQTDQVRLDSQEIKQAIACEKVDGKTLYKNEISFNFTAKIVFACNTIPYTRNSANAMRRRLIIVPFAKEFDKSCVDTNLLTKLCSELPGITNWALEGLKRLIKNKDFSLTEENSTFADKYFVEHDPVQCFLDEKVDTTVSIDSHISRTDLFKEFDLFMQESKKKSMTCTKFYRSMREKKFIEKQVEGKVCFARIKYKITPSDDYINNLNVNTNYYD